MKKLAQYEKEFTRHRISLKMKEKNAKILTNRIVAIAWTNCPNKDIAGQIHRACFDYKDMDKKVMGQRIEERVYVAYNGVFNVIKDWIEKDEQSFLDFVKKMEIDTSC